jgi:starvation-inducible outer membrane lipoprotein
MTDLYKNILIFSIIILLSACASSNKNLDEFDKMDLEDQMKMSGQTFKQKQITGEICHNPSY